jgi:predicted RNase H-like nuclease (RuvC/YqgF family)
LAPLNARRWTAGVQADEDVVGTSRVRELERRVRELERLLGRKTMEVEILKEALDVARVKKPSLQLPSWKRSKGRFPMKAVADTFASGQWAGSLFFSPPGAMN